MNTYTYAEGNPISLSDHLGLRVDWGGYVLNNPLVRGNLELLNLLIVQTGVPDDCFVIRVTGGDRYRDPNNPTVHRSSSNGSIVKDSSPTSPHLIERGARAVDFNIDNVQDPCACTVSVTNQLVDRLLLSTNFLPANTSRAYPNAPHTHVALPPSRAFWYVP